MEHQRKLLEEEQEKQKESLMMKYHEKDSKTEELIKHKEYENKIFSELEMIKKRKRLEEAKRLDRVRAYYKEKEFKDYQDERSKSAFVQEQRQKILNYKIEENQKIQAIKEKLRDKIMTAKGKFEVIKY